MSKRSKNKYGSQPPEQHDSSHEHPHSHEQPHSHEHPHSHEQPHSHGHPHASVQAHERVTQPIVLPVVRGSGRGKLLYIDAGSGIAGDMLVAALIDLGIPEELVFEGLRGLALEGYRVHTEVVKPSGIAARRFIVQVEAPQASRDHAAIATLIEGAASLSAGAKKRALAAFAHLAKAEARVHGIDISQVHFHEVGAVDSIVDIVAAAIALDYLGARIACSPLPMGRGYTKSAHGPIPLPAPATVQCLAGVPTYDAGISEELVTPTGACLVATSTSEFGGWPKLSPERVGFGAGQKEFADRPNVLRVVLGQEHAAFGARRTQGEHVVIETNVDDSTPEVIAFALSRAMDAGALDAWAAPITMKKGRPAMLLCALAARDKLDEIALALLSETTSLGLRFYSVDRIERARRSMQVETPFGMVSVKIAEGDGLPDTVAPEFESCKLAALTHDVSIRQVYSAALEAVRRALPGHR